MDMSELSHDSTLRVTQARELRILNLIEAENRRDTEVLIRKLRESARMQRSALSQRP